ncbi:MAG: hypothetical protein JXA37_02850 [Chloroflexia bacterium]|nr:hypothetical protein [Chloroflexia bacterium]
MTADKLVCAHCHEPFEGKGLQRGSRTYCCEACAFEGNRSTDCAGRTDGSQASLVEEMAFRENPPES